MSERELCFAGAGDDELRARLRLPEVSPSDLPGVVVLHDAPGPGAREEDAAERLAAAGLAALVVDLRRAGDADEALPDRRTHTDLERALRALGGEDGIDPERLAVLGFGRGGTLAYLEGCCGRDLAAAVSWAGPVVYDDLSAARPVQPLEMALGLSVPLLAVVGEDDPGVPSEHVERLSAVCSQFARDCDIVVLPGAGEGFHDPSAGSYDAGATGTAWERTLAFLGEHLEAGES